MKMEQLRKIAAKLYQSTDAQEVYQRIEQAIESGRLSLRTDKAIHADLGLFNLCL